MDVMENQWKRADTDWFLDAKWGVFIHYLAQPGMAAVNWNAQVDGFDVKGLGEQLASVGAGYLIFTIGQNSGHYCAPNHEYASIIRIKPDKCSKRDLIRDLSEALQPHGIRLMVYLPSGAPDRDPEAMAALEWKNGKFPQYDSIHPNGGPDDRLVNFQLKWERIISFWSRAWGRNVWGWWFDGCYFSNAMYGHPDPPNFRSFALAAKAGNQDGIVAFNPGVTVPVVSLTPFEDYIAGEIDDMDKLPDYNSRWVDGAQYHALTYIGKWWGSPEPRLDPEAAARHTNRIVSNGGVISWDVGVNKQGLISDPCLEILRSLKCHAI